MDMLQVFHMNKGEGDASYAKNSTVQNKILSITKPFVVAAIRDYFGTIVPPETMHIADLGCSSGPNALWTVKEIIDEVNTRRRVLNHQSPPKFMVFLNDLPGNDFNEVFASLSNFYKELRQEKGEDFGACFIAGLPGNFYGRLLPSQALHFVHSSSSLHWLSQVPPGLDIEDKPRMINKGKIYLSVTSSSDVINAYRLQFQKDFLSFLKSRSGEVMSGGRMVLAFMGRRSNDPTSEESIYPWEFISQSLMSMVFEGLIEEEKVDSLNVPYYAPCLEEVHKLIDEESSFYGDRFEVVEIEWDGGNKINGDYNCSKTLVTRGEKIAKMHRAVAESLLEHHFGGDILDELFNRYSKILDYHLMSNLNCKFVNLVISLIRK